MSNKFILYKIWYGDCLVYLGRTKQPLQSRIRGHLFKKPMHRTIFIDQVTKIEYAEFQSEADMNVYEVYYINLYKPSLNCDDKAEDNLHIQLPDVEWKEFTTHLWDKWKSELQQSDDEYRLRQQEKSALLELRRVMRRKFASGEISENDYFNFLEQNNL